MAKLNLKNGVHEVARIKFSFTERDHDPLLGPRMTWTGILVLRSDGKVLRRFTGEFGGGYSTLGKVKNNPSDDAEAKNPGTRQRLLERIATRRGYEVTS